MRTTVRLDDALARAAKVRAAEQGITLTQLIDESLRDRLSQRGEPSGSRQVDLPVYGEGGVRSGVDLSDNRALLDMMEGEFPAGVERSGGRAA
ncbi:MAG TPA: hypothetical protein VKC63_03525 [Solirubrobacterales bacterium]|nr:hypothetical protein [Solirubrobacterales bacterium]